MTTYTYTIAKGATTNNNNSYTAKVLLTVRDCSEETTPVAQNELWNCNLCGNDERYHQPYVDGDIIYLQTHFNEDLFVLDSVEIRNYDTGAVVNVQNGAVTTQTGKSGDGQWVQNYKIKPDLFYDAPECWQVVIIVADAEDEYDTFEHFTEPYRLETDCRRTILIEGVYPEADCFGYLYGPVCDPQIPTVCADSIFLLKFRVYGNIEWVNEEHSEQFVGKFINSKGLVHTYQFRTHGKIPPYVAEMLSRAWGSKQLLIEDNEYQGVKSLSKNTDDTQMWVIDTTLTTTCDDRNFNCNVPGNFVGPR